jgi:hypothetical protein
MRKNLQIKAWILLVVFTAEIFVPSTALALGSGPSQPEMASFTPANTSKMVDPFSGDFSYNIPLMDVEGYPVNIAYNSGVTMEQEASWVGLGWNLNVGAVNRSVRGLPDDFKGEVIVNETAMKPMKIVKLGAGTSSEIIGKELLAVTGNYGISLMHNSYKGFGFSIDASVGSGIGPLNGNAGVSLNSLDGISTNSSLSLSLSQQTKKNGSFNFGGSLSSGYNTRTGKKILDFSTTAGYSPKTIGLNGKKANHTSKVLAEANGGSLSSNNMKSLQSITASHGINANMSGSFSSSLLPIGMDTYSPYPSVKMTSTTFAFSASVGGEVWSLHPNFNLDGSQTTQEVLENITLKKSYGYMNIEEASPEDLTDFNDDINVNLNKYSTNLSPTNFTYDVYSVSGQGVSGMFRPFRNDIGILSNPSYKIEGNKSNSFGAEVGFGNLIRGGATVSTLKVESKYEPWGAGNNANYLQFKGDEVGSTYEKFYFKAAGDKVQTDLDYLQKIGGFEAVAFDLKGNDAKSSLSGNAGVKVSSIPEYKNTERNARAKLFSFLTAAEAQYAALDKIKSYKGSFFKDSLKIDDFDRVDQNKQAHHISEITQVNPDGERYVFGIPAYNITKQEVTYTSRHSEPNVGEGVRSVDPNNTEDVKELSIDNESGIDGYYSKNTTPAYAHSYLLTGKLSPDYRDVTGNGISPDDIGTAHKFNYTRTSNNYKWRSPYKGSSFMKGYDSDKLDQKGSISYGVKELWYMHSIESKNQIAEFYTSPRKDALGAKNLLEGGRPSGNSLNDKTYRLDSIVLYNKIDRLTNKENAIPIKKVRFEYDYSLCKGVLNQTDIGNGKLTLKKVSMSFGASELNTPYEFIYSNTNPTYNPDNMDRWGNFKRKALNPGNAKNYRFPYVLQDIQDSTDVWASAWSLEGIELPTGGKIDVVYESDDYGYVQNLDAMQMFPVIGAGNSPDFSSSNELYNNQYLYIQRPSYVSKKTDNETLKRLFLGKSKRIEDMYFNFNSVIRKADSNSPDRYDFAGGYSTAESIGFCPLDSNQLFIKIPWGSPSPISRSIWSVFRKDINGILTDQPNVNDTGLESILRGILANVGDIVGLITGYEKKLIRDKVANKFKVGESFIRLNSPTKHKKGGGSRVKSIVMNDNWNQLSGEGENSTYGQFYEYTKLNEFEEVISSGVASYEPMIGNDENPFRLPVDYISIQKQGHVPAIDAFQQKPFGESFLPSATVGYSNVTVRNIHFDKGKSSQRVDEQTFYTAKDFPFSVNETKIQITDNPAPKGTFSFPMLPKRKYSYFSASQGYSIVLNDMHGKPKSTLSYLLTQVEGSTIRKVLNGNKFNYYSKDTPKGKVLSNTTKVLTNEGYIKDKMLGVEYDFAIKTSRSYDESFSGSVQTNVDASLVPPIPAPIITYGGNGNILIDRKELRTIVATKVVQTYGIIESIESYTGEYSTTTYNKLFDGTTGEVLLTESVDEHLQNEFSYNIPAHSVASNKRMGPAYENIGYVENITTISNSDSICNHDGNAYLNKGNLKHGDEVLVYRNGAEPQKAWVELELKAPVIDRSCVGDIDTIAEVYERDRLITAWYGAYGTPCGDTLVIDSTISKFLKGERGEILENVNIFHLKEEFVDSILEIRNGIDSFGLYGETVSSDIARFLFPHEYYEQENTRFCSTFSQFDSAGVSFESIFSNGQDLSYEVNLNDASILHFFDLSDTIKANVDNINASSTNLNPNAHNNTSSPSPTVYSNYSYKVNNNSCVTAYGAGFQNSAIHEIFYAPSEALKLPNFEFWPNIKGRNCAADHFYKVDCSDSDFTKLYGIKNAVSNIDKADIVNGPYNRLLNENKSSYTVFRIENDQRTKLHQPKFLDNAQLYLVQYEVQLQDGTKDFAYFIEKGRKLRSDELKKCYFDSDDYRYNVWAYPINQDTNSIYVKPICPINFRLLDHQGNYIAGLNPNDKIKVIRSGNENRLTSKAGNVISMNDPLKIDLVDDSCKFLGLKKAEDGLQIINASSLTYKEGLQTQYTYENNGNIFLKGLEGHFRVDSTLNYISSRYRTDDVELAQDGYLEVLPPLWSKGSCNDSYFPPQWNASSGWFLNSNVTQYAASGIAIETSNNLKIPSTVIANSRNGIDLVGSNSINSAVAFDGFENNKIINHDGVTESDVFRLAEVKQSQSVNVLDSDSENNISISELSNNVVHGVFHSGVNSLFLKGVNTQDGDTVKLAYEPKKIFTLTSKLLSGEPIETLDSTIIEDYESEKTSHFNSFTANYKTSIKNKILELQDSGDSLNSIFISSGQALGNFKPKSGQFLVSIWSKELVESGTPYQGVSPFVRIKNGPDTVTLWAKGPIIDGWQKIEGTFNYVDSLDLSITLSGGLWGCFFDDFRIHPIKSNVNTYVYNEYTNRLVAKLDENNYATFYKYNDEGIPSQLMRETDAGVITISESRQSISKKH